MLELKREQILKNKMNAKNINPTKSIIFFLIVAISFLIGISSASAQEGCFIYPDSVYFCTDLDGEQAAKECLFYDCSVLETFYSGESCSDFAKFPQCQKIICKSSCEEEFLGKCASGPIPEGKQSEWCASGCCQFDYFGESFCAFKANKWLCEVEARNKDIIPYIFAQPMAEYECTQKCSAGEISVKKVIGEQEEETSTDGTTTGIQVDKVSPQQVLPKTLLGKELPQSSSQLGINDSGSKQPSSGELKSKSESSSGNSSAVIWLLVVFILLGIAYFIYKWKFEEKFSLGREAASAEPEEYSENFGLLEDVRSENTKHFNFFSLNPFIQRKISLLKAKRKHKRVIKEQKEVFLGFERSAKSRSPYALTSASFAKLKKVVRLSPKTSSAEKKEKSVQKNAFEKVREFTKAAKEKEKESVRKKESREALKKLKEMAGKRN